MDGHRPDVWCSDRFSAQQGHCAAHQTCLAHLARDVAYAEQAGEDALPFPGEVDATSFLELMGGPVMRPLEDGVADAVARFRRLLADGVVARPEPPVTA